MKSRTWLVSRVVAPRAVSVDIDEERAAGAPKGVAERPYADVSKFDY